MIRLLACRVWLAYDTRFTRLCSIKDGQLREIYEALVGASLDTEDLLPTSVCYICYSLMKKMLQFRDRSQKANQILQQMISFGLEPSVRSLDMLLKDQTGTSWTLGLSDMERTTTTSAEDKVKVEIESVESEIDIDGIVDRNEVVTKPDAREIVLSKEDQLQEVCERAKSLDYQNTPFECDLCSEAFVDATAYENHKEKHDEPSISSLVILDWHNKQSSISYPLRISDIESTTKTTTTGEVEVKMKIESVESEMGIDEMSDRNEVAAPPGNWNWNLDNNEAENELVNVRAPLRNTEKDEEPKEKEAKKKIPAFINGSKKKETDTTTPNIIIEQQKDGAFNKNDMDTPPKDIFTCDLCKKYYQCKILLESHMKKSHVIELNEKYSINSDLNVRNECKNTNFLKAQEIQNNYFEKKDNRKKFRDNTSLYKCQYCTKHFYCDSTFTKHLKVHTKRKPFKCDLSKKYSSLKENLLRHLRVHTKEKSFKCDICEKGFSHSFNLTRHLKVHTKEKPFKCNICEKGFSHSFNLTSHLKVHTKEKPFKCDICETFFSESGTLTRHLKVHTKEKPFKCDICEKCFSESGTLTKHLRVHTKEKPFKCDLCKKGFSRSFNLTAHLRVHTKEKPFKCDKCGKCFSFRGNLAKHVRVHTKEKPFKCDICEKGFSRGAYLTAHLRVHTKEKPFKCDICKKCFSESGTLTRHVRVHTKEKPFKCDMCEKCFSDRSTLTAHLRVHSKEKPFKCYLCKKSFSRSSNLTAHLRVHTK